MPILYRKEPKAASEGVCAYLDIAADPFDQLMFAGLLVTGADGIPKEFVYNSITTPSGVLWPAEQVKRAASISVAQSVFESCVQSPALLLASYRLLEQNLGPVEFGVSIPFALVDEDRLSWIGLEPAPNHPASLLARELTHRKLLSEPLERIRRALKEVFERQNL